MSSFSAVFHQSRVIEKFLKDLQSPEIRVAAARGLNEHAVEQRRQAITRINAVSGVPKSRISGGTVVIKASASGAMQAIIRNTDKAVGLGEYGKPKWTREMSGAQATAMNVRRIYPHAFMIGSRVVWRTTKNRFPVSTLTGAVLANELAKPSRPNVRAANAYVALDLERRVLKYVIKAIDD